MTACTACGHDPVSGRFCTACGHPKATAPSVAPAPPAEEPAPTPVPHVVPPPPRFPLYADQVPTSAPPAPPPPPADDATAERPKVADPPPIPPPGSHAAPKKGPDTTVWLVGIAVVLLFAVVGGGLLLMGGGGDEPDEATDPASADTGGAGDTGGAASAAPSDDTTDESPSSDAGDDASEDASEDDSVAPPESTEVLAPTDIEVPGSAPASRTNDGARVTFGSDNLVDDDPTTSWRVGGDASGEVLRLDFDDEVVLTEVGLINGYAKNDPPNDWYVANRRIVGVEWTFDDGTTVTQTFDTDERSLQTLEIDPVATTGIELRIIDVTAHGGRNYTAISEIALVGGED